MDQIRAYDPARGDYGLDKPGFHNPVQNPLDLISKLYTMISSPSPGVTLAAAERPSLNDAIRKIVSEIARQGGGSTRPYVQEIHEIDALGRLNPRMGLKPWLRRHPQQPDDPGAKLTRLPGYRGEDYPDMTVQRPIDVWMMRRMDHQPEDISALPTAKPANLLDFYLWLKGNQ